MPKPSVALIDTRIEPFIRAVEDSLTSIHSKRAYRSALSQFFIFIAVHENHQFTRGSAQRFKVMLEREGASASTVNVKLSAVRKLATELEAGGFLEPVVAQGIGRVKGAKRRGRRAGNWLIAEQCQRMLELPRITPQGLRDRAIIGIFIGCGLRRDEMAHLKPEDLQLRDGRWVFVDIVGKGRSVRTVPVPNAVKAMIDAWRACIPQETARLFVPVAKNSRMEPLRCTITGPGMSTEALYQIVWKRSMKAGLGHVRPHDLRRTFARLTHKANAPMDQIKETLGHRSVQTTEIYIGAQQDLKNAPCDLLADLW